jgi:Flp pilus assembly protein TadG
MCRRDPALVVTNLIRDRRASAAVELAMAAPALVMFLLGIVEMGRMLWVQNALSFSVAEAARCASNNPGVCGSASQTQSFAANQSGEGFDASVFTATTRTCGNQVSASYPMTLSIPYVDISVTLTADACYPS